MLLIALACPYCHLVETIHREVIQWDLRCPCKRNLPGIGIRWCRELL